MAGRDPQSSTKPGKSDRKRSRNASQSAASAVTELAPDGQERLWLVAVATILAILRSKVRPRFSALRGLFVFRKGDDAGYVLFHLAVIGRLLDHAAVRDVAILRLVFHAHTISTSIRTCTPSNPYGTCRRSRGFFSACFWSQRRFEPRRCLSGGQSRSDFGGS